MNSRIKITSLLIAAKPTSQHMITRSLHGSVSSRSLANMLGSAGIGVGSGIAYLSTRTMHDLVYKNASEKTIAITIATGLISYGLLNANEKDKQQRKFNEILTEIIDNLGDYKEKQIEAIQQILTFHHITLDAFKKDCRNFKFETWNQDDIRIWLIEKINALQKKMTNSTKKCFTPAFLREKNSFIEAIMMLYPQIKKTDFNEKMYKKLMVKLIEELNAGNSAFLEKHNGVSNKPCG